MTDSPADGRVLDIGVSLGNISEVLSEYYRETISMCYGSACAKFMKVRFTQDDTRAAVVRGDRLQLPFAAGSLDLVVLDGVLQQSPGFSPTERPREAQLHLLRECLRVLAPTGKVAIAGPNRFYSRSILGDTPHGDFPFTTFLPRRLADAVSRLLGRRSYQNHIHSAHGYERLLRQAGYGSVNVFMAVPSTQKPILILPVENNRLLRRTLMSSENVPRQTWKRTVYRMLVNMGLLKYLMHSMYVVGSKGC
jgi:SAM-dependent methyltransferase